MIEFDDSQVLNLFAALSGKDQTKAMKTALRKAAQILIRKTKSNLKNIVKNSTKKSTKYGKSLQSGIKARVNKDGTEAKVHIMGDFRPKFFESGTKDRYTRGHKITGYEGRHLKRSGKGGFRGVITGKNFFKSAQKESESQVFSSIDNLLSESIQKIASKK